MWKAFAKFLRLPNLFIVGLTQYILLHFLLLPFLHQEGISPNLDPLQFFLFVLDTVLITLSGNIANDIMDRHIDQKNRPDTVFVGRHISPAAAWVLYAAVLLLGFLLACHIAWQQAKIPLLAIYPAAVLLLYLYSAYCKKMPLLGNVIVGLFCAGVTGIVWFAEQESWAQLSPNLQHSSLLAFAAYGLFAYYTTLFREIVKDMEDMDGDALWGCRTLPIAIGIPKTKWVALLHAFPLLPLLGLLAYWLAYHEGQWGLAAVILALAAWVAQLCRLTYLAQHKEQFQRISQQIKGLMLAGLLFLPLQALLG